MTPVFQPENSTLHVPAKYGMGRIYTYDARDKSFLLPQFQDPRILMAAPPSREWDFDKAHLLNQGETSSCVGHAWNHWEFCAPTVNYLGPDAFDIYAHAQILDNIPGQEPLVQGTTVRAGAKYLQQLGRIAKYAWCRSALDVKRAILSQSPVVFGTTWTVDMFTPDSRGFIAPSGQAAGGHAYLCIGYNQAQDTFKFVNSWGRSWGQDGCFYMLAKHVELLLRRYGEACVAIERLP